MFFELPYGSGTLSVEVPDGNLVDVLQPQEPDEPPVTDIAAAVRRALAAPLDGPSFGDLLRRRPQRIVVVVEDVTRANPYYREALEALVQTVPADLRAGLRFVVALGTHRPHTVEDNRRAYGDLSDRFAFINHDCDAPDMACIGTTSFGNEVRINRTVAEADLTVLTGAVDTHSFAGYTGTRKALMPGVAARDTITRNHAMVCDPAAVMGEADVNPLARDMMEAAHLFARGRSVFVLNFIKDHRRRLRAVLAGGIDAVHREGTGIARGLCATPFGHATDVCIVSCGGRPRDINLYQAQKSYGCAAMAVRPGGTVILLAECPEGIGQELFGRWLREYPRDRILSMSPGEIVVEGHRAYLTARLLQRTRCILVSSMQPDVVASLGFEYAPDAAAALAACVRRYGADYTCRVIPNGSATLPVPTGRK